MLLIMTDEVRCTDEEVCWRKGLKATSKKVYLVVLGDCHPHHPTGTDFVVYFF